MSRSRRRRGADPVPVSESLASVGAELGLSAPGALETVRGGWTGVVGEELAEHTKPRSLRDGELRVAVDDAAWATQLRYLSGELLARLDALVGVGVVDRIRVRVVARRR